MPINQGELEPTWNQEEVLLLAAMDVGLLSD
jgi:hypothetical protein